MGLGHFALCKRQVLEQILCNRNELWDDHRLLDQARPSRGPGRL